MHSTDLAPLKRRARRAYEFARLRSALLGVAPVLFLTLMVACVAHRPISTLGFGLATVLLGAVMLWYGRDPQRAVLPGVAAGLVPLVLALGANHVHMCGAEGCGTFCVPACALGGGVAGLTVATVGRKRRAGLWYWLCASSLALLTGAMGCACMGYSGVIGLVLGFGTGVAPGLLRYALGRPRT